MIGPGIGYRLCAWASCSALLVLDDDVDDVATESTVNDAAAPLFPFTVIDEDDSQLDDQPSCHSEDSMLPCTDVSQERSLHQHHSPSNMQPNSRLTSQFSPSS
jgi:hypothetical protein